MDYTAKNLMHNDCLKLVKLVCSDIFQQKIIRFIVWILFTFHTVIFVLTIYAVLYKITIKEFTYFAPVFCGSFYSLIALWTLLFKAKMLENFIQEFPLWNIDSSGEEIQSRIKFESKIIKIFIVTNTIITVIGTTLFCLPLSLDDDLFYALYFFKAYFPEHKTLLTFIYKATYPLLGYVMVVHAYQFIYVTQHGRFQILMYIHNLADIAETEEHIEEHELFDNENYQRDIKEKLKFCIIRHQEFLEIHSNQMNQMSNLIVTFSLCGCLLGISLAFYIFSDKFVPEYYLRLGVTSIGTCCTFGAVMLAGQLIETEFDVTLNTINKVAWYNFNNSNKKTYLILLLNMMQPWKIQFSENYSVNYELGRAIVQGIYSILSVVINMI